MIKLSGVPKIEIDRNLLDNAVKRVALDARETIKKRTRSGKDVDGNTFQEYSKAYKEYKKKHGRTGLKVNLELTRNMLESLSIVKIAVAWFRIFIEDANANIYGTAHQNGSGNMPKRKWFGVNKQESDKIYRTHFWNLKVGKFR